jgi:hypothetical protein
MRLEEVLPALREGKKIYRIIWKGRKGLALKCYIHISHDLDFTTINAHDLLADDWEVEDEETNPTSL